ncbi:hypothetical protein [Streptomyces sp. NPDC059918]|uniref:hypothetical protein n=1 Tax=unclassified Streptomyces TaxID=2593676 RepID=UPI00365D12B5
MTGWRTPRAAGDRPSRTGATAPWARPAALRRGYFLIGLLFGAAWAVNRGMPVWEHAVRLLAFVIVVPPLLHAAQQRGRRKRGGQGAPHLSVLRATAAKCCLVAAAMPATALLRPYTSLADLVVGVGIAAVVALAGPWVHGSFLVRPPTGVSGTSGPSSAPGGEEG